MARASAGAPWRGSFRAPAAVEREIFTAEEPERYTTATMGWSYDSACRRIVLTPGRHDRTIHTMPSRRTMIAFASALSVVVGLTLSPFVLLHEIQSHGAVHHHSADDVFARAPGHSHDDHGHSVLQIANSNVQHRPNSHVSPGTPAGFLIPPSMKVETIGLACGGTSKPPRSRHPLSLSNALRI